MVLLMVARYKQRAINIDIDDKETTLSDYSVFVSNIPKNINIDLTQALNDYFNEQIKVIADINTIRIENELLTPANIILFY